MLSIIRLAECNEKELFMSFLKPLVPINCNVIKKGKMILYRVCKGELMISEF